MFCGGRKWCSEDRLLYLITTARKARGTGARIAQCKYKQTTCGLDQVIVEVLSGSNILAILGLRGKLSMTRLECRQSASTRPGLENRFKKMDERGVELGQEVVRIEPLIYRCKVDERGVEPFQEILTILATENVWDAPVRYQRPRITIWDFKVSSFCFNCLSSAFTAARYPSMKLSYFFHKFYVWWWWLGYGSSLTLPTYSPD